VSYILHTVKISILSELPQLFRVYIRCKSGKIILSHDDSCKINLTSCLSAVLHDMIL
jgi:hypothetical protein